MSSENRPIPINYPFGPTPADEDVRNAARTLNASAQKFDIASSFGKAVGLVLLTASDPLQPVLGNFYKVAVNNLEVNCTLVTLIMNFHFKYYIEAQITIDPDLNVNLKAIFHLPFGTPAVVGIVTVTDVTNSSAILQFNPVSNSDILDGYIKVEMNNSGQIVYSFNIKIEGVAYSSMHDVVLR
ncbi:hypothetical protein C0995_000264 [Termitomyces sp. Mi166|nr:hypothetical protein C0995_000264 [Termitomyces sp. Mi166\